MPGHAQAYDAPVVARGAPPARLPAVHPLAAIGVLAGDEDRGLGSSAGCPCRRRTRRSRRARRRRGARPRDPPASGSPTSRAFLAGAAVRRAARRARPQRTPSARAGTWRGRRPAEPRARVGRQLVALLEAIDVDDPPPVGIPHDQIRVPARRDAALAPVEPHPPRGGRAHPLDHALHAEAPRPRLGPRRAAGPAPATRCRPRRFEKSPEPTHLSDAGEGEWSVTTCVTTPSRERPPEPLAVVALADGRRALVLGRPVGHVLRGAAMR